jgi:predicted 2-oxoglutarate/Fe(II)-dependent dioxygenase YbiX
LKNQFTKLFSDDECIEIINFFEKKEDWNLKIQLDENEEIYAHYYVRVFNELEFVKNKFKNFIESEFSFKVHEVNIYALKYYQNFKFGRHIDRAYHKESNKDFVYNINVVLNDDFEGGEFWLDDKLLEGNTRGMVYYYDSTQWHEVKPIVSGTRYSMLCYVRERDFVNKQTKSLL